MPDNFFKNKKVLVTGYEGFLGSNLTRKLIDLGARVIGLDIVTRRKKTILTPYFSKMKIVKGSVANYKLITKLIKSEKIEYIFHLAATSLVGNALNQPTRAFNTNIKGTWNILEASRQDKTVKGIIVASSDKAYGIQSKLPYKENSPLAGSHPYDASKSCADLLAYTYFHTYQLPVAITRCGNIYGPGDFNFSRIIPDAFRCLIRNNVLKIRSDGKFTRDYIHVDDVVNAYLLLARKMKKLKLGGEAFNFSNESPISVLKLVKLMSSRIRYKITNQAKYEIPHQYLSAAKARKILKWKPRYGLQEGLKETYSWYRDYLIKKS